MNPENARSIYREIENQGATPLQLVVALYDVILRDIHRMIEAQERKDVEGRVAHVKHCLLAIGQLQGRLDFERGGEVANHLDRFYSSVRGKLLEASIKGSAEGFAAIASMVASVRSAWDKTAKAELNPQPGEGETEQVAYPRQAAMGEISARCGWTA